VQQFKDLFLKNLKINFYHLGSGLTFSDDNNISLEEIYFRNNTCNLLKIDKTLILIKL